MSQIQDKAILYNLRYRWPEELKEVADEKLLEIYSEFSVSEDYGNNDEHFLEFLATSLT